MLSFDYFNFIFDYFYMKQCSVKRVFLNISHSSHENTCARVSFLITLQASAWNFIKKDILAQVLFTFSCQLWKVFKKTYIYRTPGGCFCLHTGHNLKLHMTWRRPGSSVYILCPAGLWMIDLSQIRLNIFSSTNFFLTISKIIEEILFLKRSQNYFLGSS